MNFPFPIVDGKPTGRPTALTAYQVGAIRNRVADGANKSALATEYGVSRATIYAALTAL